MKINNIVTICLACTGLWSCNHNHGHESAHDHHAHHEHEHDKEHESEEKHNHDDIHMTPERCMMLGVEVDAVKPGTMQTSVKVSGVIELPPRGVSVIVAPSNGIVNLSAGIAVGVNVSAGNKIASVSAHGMAGGDAEERERLAYENAKREFERLEPLYKEGIVTATRYNDARAAYEAACDAFSGEAHGRVVKAPESGAIVEMLVENGQYVEAGTPIARILSGNKVILRADVPVQGGMSVADVVDASFKAPGMTEYVDLNDCGGVKIAAAQGAAPVAGSNYEPVYFSLDNRWNLRPGMFAEVYVRSHSDGLEVISVPREALIEQEGYYFVFIKEAEGVFEKRRVNIGTSSGSDVEILDGIACGDSIVMKGAMMVKLAASDGKAPEGHSHNH